MARGAQGGNVAEVEPLAALQAAQRFLGGGIESAMEKLDARIAGIGQAAGAYGLALGEDGRGDQARRRDAVGSGARGFREGEEGEG